MSEENLSKELILLFMNLQSFCENTNNQELNKNLFSVKFKILTLINEFGKVSPSTLVSSLNIAKSNIALFCKQLLKDKFIDSLQDEFDHRIIYYCLTEKGKKYVSSFESLLNKHISLNLEEKQQEELINATKTINNNLEKLGVKQNVKTI